MMELNGYELLEDATWESETHVCVAMRVDVDIVKLVTMSWRIHKNIPLIYGVSPWTRWTSPVGVELDETDISNLGICNMRVEYHGPVQYRLNVYYESGRQMHTHYVSFDRY